MSDGAFTLSLLAMNGAIVGWMTAIDQGVPCWRTAGHQEVLWKFGVHFAGTLSTVTFCNDCCCRRLAKQQDLEVKQRAYREHRSTTHWPSQNVTLFPTLEEATASYYKV